jgi:hypothetical protein
MIRTSALLITVLVPFAIQTASAADTCFEWVQLKDGKWFRQCQDARSKIYCHICPTQALTPKCTRKEGSQCAL